MHTCDLVWLRTDRVRKPLEAPYSGPYKVLRRSNKHFTIELFDKSESTVSIERLKPCVISVKQIETPKEIKDFDDSSVAKQTTPKSRTIISRSSTVSPPPTELKIPETRLYVSRSGRKVKFAEDNQFHYY